MSHALVGKCQLFLVTIYPFIVFGDYKEHFATRAENIIEAGKKKFEKFFRGLGVSEQPGKEPHRNISTLELSRKKDFLTQS